MIKHLSVFLFSLFLISAYGFDDGKPPDYTRITKASDMAVTAEVRQVILPKKPPQLTEVILKINKVRKGNFKSGQIISVFHEPSEYVRGKINGRIQKYVVWRCPELAKLEAGKEYDLWAEWDEDRKHFLIPGAAWVKEEK